MINLWKKENLNLLSEYPKEVFKNVINTCLLYTSDAADEHRDV